MALFSHITAVAIATTKWTLGLDHTAFILDGPWHLAGNKETLLRNPKKQGIDVRKELLSLHRRYYSANIAKLAVIGSGV